MPLRRRIMTRDEKRSAPSSPTKGPALFTETGPSRLLAEALARAPAAPEREEQRDLEVRGASLSARERALPFAERRLRPQHVEHAALPRVERRMRETGRVARVPSRIGERVVALALLRVARQRAFDFAQRIEPRAVESRERRVGIGPRLREPRAHDGSVRE